MKITNESIYSVSMKKILSYGKLDIKAKTISLTSNATYRVLNKPVKGSIRVKKPYSLFFNQIKEVLKDEEETKKYRDRSNTYQTLHGKVPLCAMVIVVSYEGVTPEDYEKIKLFENGIILNLRIFENDNDELGRFNEVEIRFHDFIRSNSMGKSGEIYYVNAEYYEKLYSRVSLGLVKSEFDKKGEERKVKLAKWYAYTGLVASNCQIMNCGGLTKDEICVVKDKISHVKDSCVTGICMKNVLGQLEDCKKELSKIKPESSYEISLDTMNTLNNLKACYNSVIKRKQTISEDLLELLEKINKIDMVDIRSNPDSALEIINNAISNPNNENKNTNDTNETSKKKNAVEKLKWEEIIVDGYTMDINNFDGVGVISNEFVYEINAELFDEKIETVRDNFNSGEFKKYKKYFTSFQIRLPFIKGMVHMCDFHQFYSDKGVTHIKGLAYGPTNKFEVNKEDYKSKMYDVSKLKIILTKSQFKIGDQLQSLELDSEVVKQEGFPKTKIDYFFDEISKYNYKLGVKTMDAYKKSNKLNYQFWSTFPLKDYFVDKDDKMNDIIFEINDERLKNSYLNGAIEKLNITKKDKANNYKYTDNFEYNSNDFYYKDKIAYVLDSKYYKKTSRYKDLRNKSYESSLEECLRGQLHTFSFRKYLSSDLLRLLYYTTYDASVKKGYENPVIYYKENHLKINSFYLPNTNIKYGGKFNKNINQPLVLLRNPHYSKSEIGILQPLFSDTKIDKDGKVSGGERDKYFKFLNRVIFINPNSLMAERLGGADYDGDEVVILSQLSLVHRICEQLLHEDKGVTKLKYPIIKIPSLNARVDRLTYENKLNFFKNSFNNSVGKLSNIACKYAISNYENDNDIDHNAFKTVLGGLEIDSAKNGFHPQLDLKNKSDDSFESKYFKIIQYYKKPRDQRKDTELEKLIDDITNMKSDKENKNKENKNIINHPLYKIVDHYGNYKKNVIDNLPDDGEDYTLDLSSQKASIVGTKDALRCLIISNLINKLVQNHNTNSYSCSQIFRRLNFMNNSINSEFIDKFTNPMDPAFKFKDKEGKNLTPTEFNSLSKKDKIEFIIYQAIDQNEEKYYFIEDIEKRKEFIKSIGYNNLDDETMKILVNYENGGFLILFYILMYLKHDNQINYVSVNYDYLLNNCLNELKSAISKKIKDSNLDDENNYIYKYIYKDEKVKEEKLDDTETVKELLDSVIVAYNEFNNYMIGETSNPSFTLRDLSNYRKSQLYDIIVKYLKASKLYNFNLKDVNNLCSLTSGNIVFNLYFEKLHQYLSLRQEGKNNGK